MMALLTSLLAIAPVSAAPAAAPATFDVLPALQQYLQIDTQNPPGNELKAAQFLKAILDREGIENELLEIAPGRACLWARLKGDGSQPGLILSHHMDVVQVERARWTVDPFAAVIKDGYLYGRGTLDMKTTGILHLATLLRLEREKIPLARDVILLATADEEVDALGMSALIKRRPELFRNVAFSLTEGEVIDEVDGAVRSYNVDISEKAAVWLRLTAKGRAGHGSVPFKQDNAVESLLAALERVRRYESPVVVLPAIARYYARLADRFDGLAPDSLRNLSRAMNDEAFRTAFLATPERAAQVRNTISITVLKGGPQTNVIPGEASAELDCRLLPGQDPAAFIAAIQALIADPNVTVSTISPVIGASASPIDSALMHAIESVAREVDPGVPVATTILTGWTESSLLRPLGIQAYGFEPYRISQQENRRVHGDDERISLENIQRGGEILYRVVLTLCARGSLR
ncbi:MAG: M20/M25/M40 family metallo-hydrolase [Acidobacteriota bacterium]